MSKWRYTKGLHELGDGCFAYLQPDGGLGWSNAGLVVDQGRSLLVDTLFDLPKTREMLEAMAAASPAARSIGTVVNTHANADHTFGNQLVGGAEIIASKACLEEMKEENPPLLDLLLNWRDRGEYGAYVRGLMPGFDFEGVELTLPTRTFEKALTLKVGEKEVRLLEVGPAHTRGDVLVHVPEQRTVFTGDMLFIGGQPILWVGPFANAIKSCDLILSWDVDVVVPGHGPITDKAGVREMRAYLVYVSEQARLRYDAGLSVEEAARDIALEPPFSDWAESDRIVQNVNLLYKEFGGGRHMADFKDVSAAMRRYKEHPPCPACGTHPAA